MLVATQWSHHPGKRHAARGIARKRPAGGWRQVAKNFRTLTHSSATTKGSAVSLHVIAHVIVGGP